MLTMVCVVPWPPPTQALGAFHVAVEIFGWEWSFGWNDDGSTGVFSGLPMLCDMHTYREKISLGFTTLSRVQVDKKLAQLEDEWMGDSYDMVCKCLLGCLAAWLRACAHGVARSHVCP